VVLAAHVLTAATAGALQATVGGRSVDLDATLGLREVIEENGSTTHERTLEQLRLRAAVALADWLRFDSTTVGTNGGPTMKSDRSGIYNLDDTFQDVSPALEFDEAYFDVSLPAVDLRLGKQKVAWGKLDRTQPNDLINPLTYTDPFLQDEGERKVGVPAAQASYYLPAADWVPEESRLTAVWVPQYVPYRFSLARCDVQGSQSLCNVERWYPPAGVPPTEFNVPAGIVDLHGRPNPAFHAPLAFRTVNGSTPSWRLENNEIGLRYSGIVREADVALYYFHGFDTQPAFDLTAEAFGKADSSNPIGVTDLRGVTTVTPGFRHIDSWGGDFAYALDRFTIRGEGAFVRGRPFTRDLRLLVTDPKQLVQPVLNALAMLADPRSGGQANVALPPSVVDRDAVDWGLGADYLYEGYLLLLQVNQTDVLHNNVELLIKDVETRLLANLRKNFLADTLETQLVALHAIESDYTLLRPRLRYRVTDHVGAEVGYLFIAGREHSVVGQYRRNDEGWVRVEYRL